MNTKEQQKNMETLTYLARDLMPALPYHNFGHVERVYSAVDTLSSLDGVNPKDRFLLKTTALLHDIIFVPGLKENEEKSAKFAGHYLPRLNYCSKDIQKIKELIMATQMPQNPKSYLQELICDADLDNLGSPDFEELGEKIREEIGLPKDVKWYEQQLNFLKAHEYHTEVAKKLKNPGKQLNIQKLERMLKEGEC